MSRTPLLLICLLAAAFARASAEPAPQLVRIVIVDKSTSMSWGHVDFRAKTGPSNPARIDIVKKELLALGEQLPPSPQHPIVLILFNSAVEKVTRYTRKDDFDTDVKAIEANGGTFIASGLREALAQVKASGKARNVWVMIYTDGDDPEQDKIMAEEEKLDRIFDDRHKKGLSQSVILKRWAHANARLLTKLKQYRHTRVVDSETAQLQAVTLRPDIRLVEARWLAGKGRVLRAQFDARIDAQGSPPAGLAPVEVRCLHPGAGGDAVTRLVPGKTVRLTVQLPVADLKERTLKVPFAITEPAEIVNRDSLTLPMLALDRVEVPVALPVLIGTIRGRLAPGAARWLDPLTRKALVPVQLTLEVRQESTLPWPRSIEVAVKGTGDCQVHAGETVRIDGPGDHSFALEVATAAAGAGPLLLHLEITPRGGPDITFEPTSLHLKGQADLPPPVTTTLRTRVLRSGGSRWTDLRAKRATFTARVEVEVAGPLARDTVFTLVAPAGVRAVSVSPRTIRSGKQVVTIRGQAVVEPRPARTALVFQVQPPAPQGGVTVRVAGPLVLEVRGPAPARMALQIDGRVGGPHETTVLDNRADRVDLGARPVVLGVDPRAARGLTGTIRVHGPFALLQEPGRVEVGKPVPVLLRPTGRTSPWFFFDARLEGEIEVVPTSPALKGSRAPLVVIVQSPFKRLARALALGLGGLASVGVVLYLFTRLRRPARPWSPRQAVTAGEPPGETTT